MNEIHATKLSYSHDARSSVDPETEQRTWLNAEARQVLNQFRFAPDPAGERMGCALTPLGFLAVWLVLLTSVVAVSAGRIAP